ncbi:MAG: IS30 family transposase, partial [Desulfobulbaceae bacterium]|nr:IS30 family transposase [Desulfobulbaceae bacterium]
GALVTLADRASRYTLATMLPRKHSIRVLAVVKRLLSPHKRKRHIVTFDNGKEFAGHEEIAKELKLDVYFAHSYHSWSVG